MFKSVLPALDNVPRTFSLFHFDGDFTDSLVPSILTQERATELLTPQ